VPLIYRLSNKHQVLSTLGDFEMGRTTKDAGPNQAFYFFKWKTRGEHFSGTGQAQEKKNYERPCLIEIEMSMANIFKHLTTRSGNRCKFEDFSEEDEMRLADYLGEGIYLISKYSMSNKVAEILQPLYRTRLVLRHGCIREYEDGEWRSNSEHF